MKTTKLTKNNLQSVIKSLDLTPRSTKKLINIITKRLKKASNKTLYIYDNYVIFDGRQFNTAQMIDEEINEFFNSL
jgi:hypothetical protein